MEALMVVVVISSGSVDSTAAGWAELPKLGAEVPTEAGWTLDAIVGR